MSTRQRIGYWVSIVLGADTHSAEFQLLSAVYDLRVNTQQGFNKKRVSLFLSFDWKMCVLSN